MANTIQIKRKSTTGAPSLASLAIGELCFVVPDSVLYVKKDAATLINLSVIEDGSYSDLNVSSSGSVFTINSGAITTGKIGNFQVDGTKIATGAVNNEKIGDEAVRENHLKISGTKGANKILESDTFDGFVWVDKPVNTDTQLSNAEVASAALSEGFKLISVGTTAPSSPTTGDLWVDTN